jgi:hypothetical protein
VASEDEHARKFMEIYSNLPIKVRREIVVVVDNEPLSWEVAYREIAGKTELGAKILRKLRELRIM